MRHNRENMDRLLLYLQTQKQAAQRQGRVLVPGTEKTGFFLLTT